jgi:DNA primase
MAKKQISEFFPGVWKDTSEFVTRCIFCGDHKDHWHLNINVSLKVCHCFRCGKGSTLLQLFQEAGYDYSELDADSPPVIEEQTGIQALDLLSFPLIRGVMTPLDRLAMNYAISRGLTREDVEMYNLRYAQSGRFYGRVMIPVFEVGVFVCISGRSMLPCINPKYMTPHRGETILTSTEAVFGIDNASDLAEKVVIVEGAFDAIAVNKVLQKEKIYAVALSTNHISKVQLSKIVMMKKPLVVMLDATAHKEALTLARSLKRFVSDVSVAKLSEGDPSSLGERIREAVLQPFAWDREMF